MERVWRLAIYLTSFCFGRGALFAAPLVLANILSAQYYGGIEWAQAAASLASTIAVLGTASVVPLVMLGHTSKTTLAGILAHHLSIVVSCIFVALISIFFRTSALIPLAALFTAAITMQSLWSVYLKTNGQSEASILIDAGLFGLMAIAAVLAQLVNSEYLISSLWVTVLSYAVVLSGLAVLTLRRRLGVGEVLAYKAVLVLGVPLMIGGVVTLIATTSGRLGIGLLAGPVVTAEYAVLARAAALPIVAHQVVLVARFRHVFSVPIESLGRVVATIIMLVAVCVLLFWICSPWLSWMLGPTFKASFLAHHRAAVWILVQSILWSAIALNDLVIARYQVMPKILPLSIGYLLCALLIGWWILQRIGPTLENFVYVHGCIMLVFYVVQSAAMLRVGVRLWGAWCFASISYVSLILLADVFG